MPPIVGDWAQRLYDRLAPVHQQDAALGYPFLIYLGAMGDKLMEDIDFLVSDSDIGPGWSRLFDTGTCPSYALPWLGQIVGVRVNPLLSDLDQREQIREVGGWSRGTPGSMLAAAQPYLTGTKFTLMIERYGGDAYQILYITHTAETPADPTLMEAAVIAQKPAGIVLTFANYVGQTWGDVKSGNATWQDVKNNFALWNDVRNG